MASPQPITRSFLKVLSSELVFMFNSSTKGSPCPRTSCRLTSRWSPRRGRILLSVGAIALLNADFKLFAKILANRLLPHLTHRDQAGFVPLCETRENTIVNWVVNLIHALIGSIGSFCLPRWSILDWIFSLYSCPFAAIKVNETRSDFFTITNGTLQGCPLSPIIFILSLEPFLCTLRADP